MCTEFTKACIIQRIIELNIRWVHKVDLNYTFYIILYYNKTTIRRQSNPTTHENKVF